MDVLDIVKTWGPLTVSVASFLYAWRANGRSHAIQAEQHRWKVEDRERKLASEAAERAYGAWCEEMRAALDGNTDTAIPVPLGKREWARRGDRKFFVVTGAGDSMTLRSLLWLEIHTTPFYR